MKTVPGLRLLLQRARRDLLTLRYRALAIVLIIGSGVAVYTGIYSAIDSLFATRDALYRQGGMADLEIRFILDDQKNLPALEDLPTVAAVESRLLLPGHLELGGGHPAESARLSATLVGLDLTRRASGLGINRLTILEGEGLDPSSPESVVIDRNLARYHGVKLGDTLHLVVGKDHYRDLTVRGIALSPEYLLASADPSVLLPSKGSMGVLFAPLDLVADRLGFRPVNSLVFRLHEAADPGEQRELVERVDRKLAVEEVIPRSRQFGYLFLEKDLQAFALFIPAILWIFAITAVLVTLFLMFQWIVGQRREVGVLMALGYGRPRLSLAYLAPALALGVLAVPAGWALSWITLYGFGVSYAGAIGMPAPHLHLEPALVGWGALGILGVLLVAVAWPQVRLLRLRPQEAVRGDRGGRGHGLGPFARRLASPLGGHLWLRYAARSLLRYRGMSVMTVASVAMALGVSISYFISMTSFEQTLLGQFRDDRWDVAVDFLAPVWDDELDMFDPIGAISEVEPYLRGSVRLVARGRQESSLTSGIRPAGSLQGIEIVQGRGLEPDDRDVLLLEQGTASRLRIAPGDPVVVDSRGERYEARVAGLFSGTLPGESYAPLAAVRRWLDLDEQSSGVFLRTSAPPETLRNELYGLDRVARVTTQGQLIDGLLEIMDEILTILWVTEGFSIAVAALFVFSSASFTVSERTPEYATLRILGFRGRQIAAMVVTEILLLGMVSAALAVPLGYGLAVLLTGRLSEAWLTVHVVARWSDVLVILVPALLLLPLVAWPAIRGVLRAELPKTLREGRFG
jgi:ABC-type lipoprotein release transport system permease subunit